MIYIMEQMERYDWTGKNDITPHWSERYTNKSGKR
jgi:hypothetical protein